MDFWPTSVRVMIEGIPSYRNTWVEPTHADGVRGAYPGIEGLPFHYGPDASNSKACSERAGEYTSRKA